MPDFIRPVLLDWICNFYKGLLHCEIKEDTLLHFSSSRTTIHYCSLLAFLLSMLSLIGEGDIDACCLQGRCDLSYLLGCGPCGSQIPKLSKVSNIFSVAITMPYSWIHYKEGIGPLERALFFKVQSSIELTFSVIIYL